MAKQYKYQKIITPITTYELVEPDYELLGIEERVQYVGELDGFTYVNVPDSLILPEDQPVFLIEANYETDRTQAHTASIVKQRIKARHQALVDNLPSWAVVGGKFDDMLANANAATNLAQAKAVLIKLITVQKKMARILYWNTKDTEE